MLNNKKGISLIVLVLIIALVVIVGVVTVTFVMNKNNPSNDDNTVNSSSTNKDNTNTGSNSSTNLNFSQTLKFMGYNIGYPDGVNLWNSDYGHTFRYNSEIAVLIEAPSVAGVMFNNTKLEDAATISEKYVIKTFENTVRELFSFGATTQIIEKSSVMTQNGIEMLRVEGIFKNTYKNTEIEFVGYYLMVETDPVYIIGIPMSNATGSIKDFMDELASHITK